MDSLEESAQFDPWPNVEAIIDGEPIDQDEDNATLHTAYKHIDLTEPPTKKHRKLSQSDRFLIGIAQDTADQIRAIQVLPLLGRMEETQWASLLRHMGTPIDPFDSECPQHVIGAATTLTHAKEYEQGIELITIKDRTGKRVPKWPNNWATVSLLVLTADKKNQIAMLTDKQGNPRFPDNTEAINLLSHAYNMTGRYIDTIDLIENQNPNSSIWKDPRICKNLVYALNGTEQFDEVIRRFVDINHSKFKLPCPPTPNLMGRICTALNLTGMYQLTYELLQPFLYKSEYKRDERFMLSMSFAINKLGKSRGAIAILTENGEYRFPKSLLCMQIICDALINSGQIHEAEQLLYKIKTSGKFLGKDFTDVENTLLEKKWCNQPQF